MARTQFTFTFTNAQAGADVTFSAPVYANATTKVQDGPRLVLDSSNAVSVWADAAHLVATTIDGLGLTLSATATAATPSVTDADGTAGPAPTGGSVAGALTRYGPVVIDFDSANLETGIVLFTPAVGDVLDNIEVKVLTEWDITAATGTGDAAADFFTASDDIGGALVNGDPTSPQTVGLSAPGNAPPPLGTGGRIESYIATLNGFYNGYGSWVFDTTAPVKIKVTNAAQDGPHTCTQGSVAIYYTKATPTDPT